MDKIKILCAEDRLLTKILIKEKMEAKGWEVIEASDGVEALEKYKQCHPDLIILDVAMPRLTGIEVLQLIRLTDLLTPIVIYSSLASDEDVELGLISGASNYVIKDYSVNNLLLLVEKLFPKSVEEIVLANNGSYNFTTFELKIGDKCKKLGTLERKVFAVLCRNKNKLCQRNLLLQAGWGSTEVNIENQLNKMIRTLRQRLKGMEGVEIVLDKGNGYYLKTT